MSKNHNAGIWSLDYKILRFMFLASCRVSDQGTILRASDLHTARATIRNPFSKTFSENNALNSHFLIHTGEKYQCISALLKTIRGTLGYHNITRWSCQTSTRVLVSWTLLGGLKAAECVDPWSWCPIGARWGLIPENVLANQSCQCPHPLKIAGTLLPHEAGHCRAPGETKDGLH